MSAEFACLRSCRNIGDDQMEECACRWHVAWSQSPLLCWVCRVCHVNVDIDVEVRFELTRLHGLRNLTYDFKSLSLFSDDS